MPQLRVNTFQLRELFIDCTAESPDPLPQNTASLKTDSLLINIPSEIQYFGAKNPSSMNHIFFSSICMGQNCRKLNKTKYIWSFTHPI